MTTFDLYVGSISIYIGCIVIFVIITVSIYKKYRDNDFLSGIFLSGVLNLLLLLPLLSIYFFILGYVSSFLFGYVAGYFNKNYKRGLLSGAMGILFSWILFGILSPLGFLLFYSLFYAGLLIIPTILFGGIGGVIGGKIRQRNEDRNTSEEIE
ncbi:MAG: hypothetical protein ACW98X_10235 [Promethearchaeota archaeon]|jgi:hypothetical protein